MIHLYHIVALSITAGALLGDIMLTHLLPMYCVSVLLCMYCMELCRQRSNGFVFVLIVGIALLAFVRQDFWFIAWCLPLTYATLLLKRFLPPFAWLPLVSMAGFVLVHTGMRAFMEGVAVIPFLQAYALPAVLMNSVIMVFVLLLFAMNYRYSK